MSTRNAVLVLFILATFVAPSVGVRAAERAPEKIGQANSPLTVLEHDEVVAIDAGLATRRAALYLGVDPASLGPATLVKCTDNVPLGPPSTTMAWVVQCSINIARGGQTAHVLVNVFVDATSGRVNVISTKARETWVLPVLRSQNPEELAYLDGWDTESDVPEETESSIGSVLGALWAEGVQPDAAGQVVLRPRWIRPRFPAALENGTLVPLRGRERVWLVQVCGTRIRDLTGPGGAPAYASGIMIQFRDGSLEFIRSFLIP